MKRGGPRCAPVADLGFRRPACSPLAVVASEPTLGATAYEGGGGAGVRSRSPRGGPRLGGLALSKAKDFYFSLDMSFHLLSGWLKDLAPVTISGWARVGLERVRLMYR